MTNINSAGPTQSIQPRKLNCWEFMHCGREPGGRCVSDMGVCPAAVESRLDGCLGGANGGRACWLVAGTFCGGAPQGTFAKRYATCRQCAFFKKMQSEEVSFLSQVPELLLYLSASEAEELDRHNYVLSQIVDPAVMRYALRDVSVLGKADEKHVTAFFSDIAGFSELSLDLGIADLGSFLNEYFSAMTEILKAEGGTLDKYIGDAIVGIFGAPVGLENDALCAARAALRMQHRLAELRSEWRERGVFGPRAWSLQMRIGLSSGLANVGFMGTSHFSSYTMSGVTVNLAKWLEQACKAYQVPILVSQATRDLIASEMVLRTVDTARPKGYVGAETIYELLGRTGATPPELMRAAEVQGHPDAVRAQLPQWPLPAWAGGFAAVLGGAARGRRPRERPIPHETPPPRALHDAATHDRATPMTHQDGRRRLVPDSPDSPGPIPDKFGVRTRAYMKSSGKCPVPTPLWSPVGAGGA